MQRYGRVFSIWVALLMLLNMGIAMTAEYTAVGDLFELVIGTERVPIVVIIGVVSMLYTAYGGLYVSIVTDQWQVCSQTPLFGSSATNGLIRSVRASFAILYLASIPRPAGEALRAVHTRKMCVRSPQIHRVAGLQPKQQSVITQLVLACWKLRYLC